MSHLNNDFIGWHWVDADEIGPCINKEYSKSRVPIITGKIYDVNEIINNQVQELYASSSITQALKNAPSPYLCRVRLLGTVHKDDSYYYWARQREVLWIMNAEKVLHIFSCLFTRKMLERLYITDDRVLHALNTKMSWIDGKATQSDVIEAVEVLHDNKTIYNISKSSVKASMRKANWDRVSFGLVNIIRNLENFNSVAVSKRFLDCINTFPKSEHKNISQWLENELQKLVYQEGSRLGITEYMPEMCSNDSI